MARRGAPARKGTWRPRRKKPSHTPADVDRDGDAADRGAVEGARPPAKGHRAAAAAAAGGGFFCCYLLRSMCPRTKGRTYIGFTVSPRRRIRQHNGEIGSGAWRTRRGRPWEMVLCIYGFPSNVAALQFEWAWQHPTESLAVRKAAAEFKSLSGIGNKIKLAYTMLNLPSWENLNLTVNFFSSKNTKFTAGCPSLPNQMKTVVCAMEDLPQCQADGPSSEEDGNDIRDREEPQDNDDEELPDSLLQDGYSYPDRWFQQPSSDDQMQVQPMDEQTRTSGSDVEDGNDIRGEPQDNEDEELSDSPLRDGYSHSDHWFQQPSWFLQPSSDDRVQPMEEQTRAAGSDVEDDLSDELPPAMGWSEIFDTGREFNGPRTSSPLCSLSSPCNDAVGLEEGSGLVSPLLMPNASSDGGDGCHILSGNHVVDLVTPTPVGRLRRRDCVSSICPKIIDLTASPVVIQL